MKNLRNEERPIILSEVIEEEIQKRWDERIIAMKKEVSLNITGAYREKFANLSFGIGTVQGCSYFEKSEPFKLFKRELLRKMRRKANLAEIEERINLYDQFFQEWGYPCPLPGHFKRAVAMGFPIVNLYIDTHIMAEMCHGILMAIQDFDRFEGEWRLDLANGGETFQGVSGGMLLCKEEEIVLRDKGGIVCSLFQGPDFRTKIDPSSRNMVVYVFTAPGIKEEHVGDGIRLALEILEQFGGGTDPWWKVFHP